MKDSFRVLPTGTVTAQWERDEGRYPDTVLVPFADGHVLKYRRDIEQPHPSFQNAMALIQGYPEPYPAKHVKKRRTR